MNHRERFLAVMAYQPVDRVPNWEAGAWAQTRQRWEQEEPATCRFHWNWFVGEQDLGMDPREYIKFDYEVLPRFEQETLAEDDRTITFRDGMGRVRKGLKEGTVGGARMSMDTFVSFPIHTAEDWREIRKRYELAPNRYEPYWSALRPAGWRQRQHPLIVYPDGFYAFARNLMGIEGVSFAFRDEPDLIHEMMDFWAEFLIEGLRPLLAETTVDYICFGDDQAMHSGPLLSPRLYRTFILPRFKRTVDFLKSHGVRYVAIDTDGNPEALAPMMLDAGLDALWPCERAADQDPLRLRRKFGRSLRLWGGVDKRVLTQGPAAIDDHLRSFRPLIAEGGFIPTVDHTVPPDVPWANFAHYMQSKAKLLCGEL